MSHVNPIRYSATNAQPPDSSNVRDFRDEAPPNETPRAPSSLKAPEPQVTPPEPQVTSSPKVCPGEHPQRPKTKHSRASYTHRLLFVESAARATPRQFQRVVRAGDLRSRRSPKFVNAIEWHKFRLPYGSCLASETQVAASI
jgi:hypothetical protein